VDPDGIKPAKHRMPFVNFEQFSV